MSVRYLNIFILLLISSCTNQNNETRSQGTVGNSSPTIISESGSIHIDYSNNENQQREVEQAKLGKVLIGLCTQYSKESINSVKNNFIPSSEIKFGEMVTQSSIVGGIADFCNCKSRSMKNSLKEKEYLFLANLIELTYPEIKKMKRQYLMDTNPFLTYDGLERTMEMNSDIRLKVIELLHKHNYIQDDSEKIIRKFESIFTDRNDNCKLNAKKRIFTELIKNGVSKGILHKRQGTIRNINVKNKSTLVYMNGTRSQTHLKIISTLDPIERGFQWPSEKIPSVGGYVLINTRTLVKDYNDFYYDGAKIQVFWNPQKKDLFAIPINNQAEFFDASDQLFFLY